MSSTSSVALGTSELALAVVVVCAPFGLGPLSPDCRISGVWGSVSCRLGASFGGG